MARDWPATAETPVVLSGGEGCDGDGGKNRGGHVREEGGCDGKGDEERARNVSASEGRVVTWARDGDRRTRSHTGESSTATDTGKHRSFTP